MVATKELAEHHGARLHFGVTAERSVLERDYDLWIAAAGPWIRQWVPIPVTQTVQTYAYLDAQVEGPVWIHHDGDYVYGFPTDELGLRAAPHRLGPEIDDLDGVRAVSDEAVTAVQRTVHKIFGIDARVVSTHTCLYTNYANEDFQLGRIGGNGFYSSVCSGHGFKFGPYIGKLMADFVEGKDAPERHARWATNYPDA
jgi:sarcosine oxidase